MLTLLFSIEFSDYGATIVSQLSLLGPFETTDSSKPLLLNINKDLSTHGTVIADKTFKGKSTGSVILTYFNSVAKGECSLLLKFCKRTSFLKAQESPF